MLVLVAEHWCTALNWSLVEGRMSEEEADQMVKLEVFFSFDFQESFIAIVGLEKRGFE